MSTINLLTLSKGLLWLNLLATWFMVGLIWFVQVVHYPLFDLVDQGGFAAYEQAHRWRTSLVVGPPMLLEVTTALGLVLVQPKGVNSGLLWVGLLMLGGIWLLTALASIPSHEVLSHGYSAKAHQFLVVSNWGRTLLWTARGLIMGYILIKTSG
jgi:hypothetical protein